MAGDKKATTIGCLMIVAIFIGIGFVLPYVSVYGIESDALSTKVISWIFIAVVLILAIIFIPKMMFVWFGIPIIAILAVWIISGDSSGTCVPIDPGSCE
jgi:hypothetical protein